MVSFTNFLNFKQATHPPMACTSGGSLPPPASPSTLLCQWMMQFALIPVSSMHKINSLGGGYIEKNTIAVNKVPDNTGMLVEAKVLHGKQIWIWNTLSIPWGHISVFSRWRAVFPMNNDTSGAQGGLLCGSNGCSQISPGGVNSMVLASYVAIVLPLEKLSGSSLLLWVGSSRPKLIVFIFVSSLPQSDAVNTIYNLLIILLHCCIAIGYSLFPITQNLALP